MSYVSVYIYVHIKLYANRICEAGKMFYVMLFRVHVVVVAPFIWSFISICQTGSYLATSASCNGAEARRHMAHINIRYDVVIAAIQFSSSYNLRQADWWDHDQSERHR